MVSYAYEHGLSLVPQGGNTGLVGGSTPCNSSEIILSLSRMNVITKLSSEGILECQAGCILETLK